MIYYLYNTTISFSRYMLTGVPDGINMLLVKAKQFVADVFINKNKDTNNLIFFIHVPKSDV